MTVAPTPTHLAVPATAQGATSATLTENKLAVTDGVAPDLAPGGYLSTVALVTLEEGGRTVAHKHGGIESIYVLQGSVDFRSADGLRVVLNRGQGAAVLPGTALQAIKGGDGTAKCLAFFMTVETAPFQTNVDDAPVHFRRPVPTCSGGPGAYPFPMPDAYALVLHSHLPYVRGAGRWPHGEEWIHEAILGTYLPLLVLLHDLRAAGVGYRLTLGLTPTLIEQLADPDICARFVTYVDDQIHRAELDAWDFGMTGASSRGAVAEFYRSSYLHLKDAFLHCFGRDIVGGFADLARTGEVEILTSAATHGYLPLLDDRSVEAQLGIGVASTHRLTGLEPTGIWLPECAYRPGLERSLERHGLTHFFTDAALMQRREVGRAQRTIRPTNDRSSGGGVVVAPAEPLEVDPTIDLFRPYLVADSGVAVISRHPEISGQVWSAAQGYPGDPFYREFHRKDDRSGLRYWRVTATTVDLGEKSDYDMHRAAERVHEHARHFASSVREALAAHRAATGRDGLLVTSFDSELFGHWWFEGIDWLGLVLRDLGPASTTVAGHLDARPPRERIALAEGSWGKRNDHSTWLAPETEWMWTEIRSGAARLRALAEDAPRDAFRKRAADQALREFLLLESSDWPFLVTTGQAGDYASERFRSHAQRLGRAIGLAQHGTDHDDVELRNLERADNAFPDARIECFAEPARVG
ncbi:MAG TPA: 1,4-alpha-glucan branching protein domain-containing protein [Candidatus Limnocylindria bacterium]|nr:1,4-alpha-glucan branching protein domain-containing protein [Candidatus Limnocylindria bacterium]